MPTWCAMLRIDLEWKIVEHELDSDSLFRVRNFRKALGSSQGEFLDPVGQALHVVDMLSRCPRAELGEFGMSATVSGKLNAFQLQNRLLVSPCITHWE